MYIIKQIFNFTKVMNKIIWQYSTTDAIIAIEFFSGLLPLIYYK